MKYAICVGDGMADVPYKELDNFTPLEYACTPNMDKVAKAGFVGRVQTIPDGLPPGSDVANMSLLGYDAAKYYSGRAPIEAASLGVDLKPGDVAFRCNLVNLRDGVMADYSAGHIETEDAGQLVRDLDRKLGNDRVRFYSGVSYRHLLVVSRFPNGKLQSTPPHDISGKKWRPHLPVGEGSDELFAIMEKARDILATAPINRQRIASGKVPATDIWLWGQGGAVRLPTMKDRYALTGSVISAVDLVQGLGVLAGLTVRKVRGATGYLGTNYAGKVAAAAEALRREDFVFLHVEAPDETSHEGSLQKKIQAIEEFDRNIVGEMLALSREFMEPRLLVLPDHATPVVKKTHDAAPVPFALCGSGVPSDGSKAYCERAVEGKALISAVDLFDRFIKGPF